MATGSTEHLRIVPDPTKDPGFDPSEGNPFVIDASTAAARVLEQTEVNPAAVELLNRQEATQRARNRAEKGKKPDSHQGQEVRRLKKRRGKLGKVTAFAAGVGVGLAAPYIIDGLNGPEFSDRTIEVSVPYDSDLWSVVDEIDGIDDIDKGDAIERVKHDPANAQLFRNSDGTYSSTVHPGDRVVIPESVNP